MFGGVVITPVSGTIHDRWAVWERFRPQFLEALEHAHGTHNEDDVLVNIACGKYHIWDADTAAGVTFVIEWPRFNGLNIFLAAGDMDRMGALVPDMTIWAARNNIRRVVWGGRRGWLRAGPGVLSMGELMYMEVA